MIIEQSMMLITSSWGNPSQPTFKMIPVSDICPYQEAIFDPESKILAIISKFPMKKFSMVPRLDGMGQPMLEYGKDKGKPKGYKQERIQIDSFNEYYIEDAQEIAGFVKAFAVNINSGDWSEKVDFFLAKPVVPPGEIGIEPNTLKAVKDPYLKLKIYG